MTYDKIIETVVLLDPAIMATLIPAIIIISHGFIKAFKINSDVTKVLIPLVLSLYAVLAFVVLKDNYIMMVLNTILALWGGSMGIFSGLKRGKSGEPYQANILDEADLEDED